ncbi:MAG TPA: hypothetical protein VK212_09970 [Lentimicrobium sp.]|nr:hypothetical protein [Lentimicrobium sp.]
MNTSALIMMITVESIVVFLTGYFFYKVLVTKPKPEDESDDRSEEE